LTTVLVRTQERIHHNPLEKDVLLTLFVLMVLVKSIGWMD